MTSAPTLPAWLQPEPDSETKPAGVIEDGMDYEDRLFHYTYATRHDELHFLEYRLLQRMNIFHLQNKLARLKGSSWKEQKGADADMEELRSTLHHYGVDGILSPASAVKDYAFMRSLQDLPQNLSSERQRDLAHAFPEIAELDGGPYNSRYCTLSSPEGIIPSDPLRKALSNLLPRSLTYTKSEMESHFDEFLAGKPPSTISPFVDKVTRFLIAFAGGASLVVPMLIMSLPSTSRTKSLVTVSVAVTLFASLLSIGIRTNNAETLVATATYAAVLVVFVGTSS